MANETAAKPKPNWTVMVYMVADTGDSFYQAAMKNITEMTEAKFNDQIKVVVHADAPSPWRTKCWEVKGASEVKKGEATEIDCQHSSLLDFVEKCMNSYESDYYLLVLWGHGEGIDWKAKVLANRPAGSEIIGAGKRSAPGSGGALEIGEIGKALSDLKLPQKIKKSNVVVGFDACLMGMVEIYYQIAPYVGWAVAANDEIPDTGWPYMQILNKLGEKPRTEPESLARAIVVQCSQFYSKGEFSSEDIVSFSATELNEDNCKDLRDRVEELKSQLTEHLKIDAGLKSIREAREFAQDFREKAYVDLHAFCAALQRKAELKENEAALRELGRAAAAANEALKAFVAKYEFSDVYPYMYWQDARAVSICFPESPDLEGTLPGQQIDWGSYKELKFSEETGWYTFVDQFLKVLGDTASPVP